MVTVKLFTRFGLLVKQEHLPVIVVPEAIKYGERLFIRDYFQAWEWQRYTETQCYGLPAEEYKEK